MAWNPYTDQKNRAYSSILTTLFPEQTKTVPRIIVWSLIFLLDLTAGIFCAFHFGWLRIENHSSMNGMYLSGTLILAAILVVFWLQGVIWGAITRFFQKRKELG